MLKRLHDKSRILFSIAWIIAYCVLMSAADSLSELVGIRKIITLPVGILLSVILLVFLKKNALLEYYGLCKSTASARSMVYYIPVFVMLTTNLWYGVGIGFNSLECVLYILSMFCVGFLEEIIFRGLLFNAMRNENVKAAIVVSSLSFGIGHAINLINGSGAELIPNLLQVIYATAAGFMFVMIYYKTNSLIGCIIAHGLFNALSVFSNEAYAKMETRILFCVILTVITAGYGAYIAVSIKQNKNE